jgi:hypothetical protein
MIESLLSRLEALTEPSREIDDEIAAAFGWTLIDDDECSWRSPAGKIQQSPCYTKSLDAALTLLGERPCVLKIMNANGKSEARVGGAPGEGFVITGGEHTLPSVALLIAIMKAKEETP